MISALFLLLAPAFAAPAPVQLSAKEEAVLDKREIVIRDSDEDGVTYVTSVIDIQAPPDKVMDAVIDLPARAKDIDSLKKVEVYSQSETALGARYEVSALGMQINFHTLYTIDRVDGMARYELDPSKENDLDSASGSYQVYAVDDGTRLVYRTILAGSSWMPDFARKAITTSSLPEQLNGMRVRAEAN